MELLINRDTCDPERSHVSNQYAPGGKNTINV